MVINAEGEAKLAEFWRIRSDCSITEEEKTLDEITKLYFASFSAQKTDHVVAIDFLEGNYYSHADYQVDLVDEPDMELSEADAESIKKAIEQFDVLNWDRTYPADVDRTGSTDGDSWVLYIQFADNTKYSVWGEGLYPGAAKPKGFEDFLEEIIRYGY